jgi:hypothetical protein
MKVTGKKNASTIHRQRCRHCRHWVNQRRKPTTPSLYPTTATAENPGPNPPNMNSTLDRAWELRLTSADNSQKVQDQTSVKAKNTNGWLSDPDWLRVATFTAMNGLFAKSHCQVDG